MKIQSEVITDIEHFTHSRLTLWYRDDVTKTRRAIAFGIRKCKDLV